MRLGVFIRHTCVLDIMCLAIPLVSVYHTRHHQHALPCVASHHQATHGHKSVGFKCAIHVQSARGYRVLGVATKCLYTPQRERLADGWVLVSGRLGHDSVFWIGGL